MTKKIGQIGVRHVMHACSIVLWILTILIGLCMFLLPFLTIDRNFTVTPELSLVNFSASWDPVMLEAIRNSAFLSAIASLFAISCGSVLTRALKRWPVWVGIGIVLVYCINPVIRALSFGALFTIYTPTQEMMSRLFGEWQTQMIILPALILGAHYLPIYLMRFLFLIRKSTVSHTLNGILDSTFVSLPAFLRGFPVSFALFFLLTFFDYWVIQVIGGGKALYWSQMFEQKAFVARDIGQAGMLIILGLLMTLAASFAVWAFCALLRMLLRHVRPLFVASLRLPSFHIFGNALGVALLLFLAWPLLYTIIRTFTIFSHPSEVLLMNGAMQSIIFTIILSGAIALCSTFLAFAFSALFQEYPARCRWWLPALYFLALVPEAAYVLFSLCVTGLGILKASPLWLFFLMTSFSAPMSFFLWESLWGEIEQRKLWMLASAMHYDFFGAIGLALREWRRFFGLTFIINCWMILDNVFITNFSAGPKWKPMSATIFTATKRGFQDAEFLTGTLTSLCVLVVIGLIFFGSKQWTVSEE